MAAAKSPDEELTVFGTLPTEEEDESGYVNFPPRISADTLNRLPSRNISIPLSRRGGTYDSFKHKNSLYKSLRLKNATLSSQRQQIGVNKVCDDLYSDPRFDDDEDKLAQLRKLNLTLGMKKLVKAKLDADEQRWKKPVVEGGCMLFWRKVVSAYHRYVYDTKSHSWAFQLWKSHINAVQGHFGGGVAAYFIIVRWLLFLNLFNFMFNFLFVIIPQLCYEYSSQAPDIDPLYEKFHVYDLLTGAGWLKHTLFYYGNYANITIRSSSHGIPYSMPLAYLFSLGVCALINLICITYYLTSTYDKNVVDTSGDVKHAYASKVFCAWDYTVETEDAAEQHKICVFNELMELLRKEMHLSAEETVWMKIYQFFLMLFVNIFVVSLIIGSGFLIYYLLDGSIATYDDRTLHFVILPLSVTWISILFYYLFKYVTMVEYFFSENVRFYLTVIRVVSLRTVMLSVIMYFWIAVYPKKKDKEEACYETDLGHDLYRLILFNFVMALLTGSFVSEYLRRYASQKIEWLTLAEFDVAYNILDLVHYQTLIWIGCFCSPMLSLMGIILLTLLFYLKLISLTQNCRPCENYWSATQAEFLFLIVSLGILMFAYSVVGYIIFMIPPSTCGPLKPHASTVDVFRDALYAMEGKHGFVEQVLDYCVSPGVLFAVAFALGMSVIYARANSKAHEAIVNVMRDQLIWLAKDKVFLLRAYDETLRELEEKRKTGKIVGDLDDFDASGAQKNSSTEEVATHLVCDKTDIAVPCEPTSPSRFNPAYAPANTLLKRPPFKHRHVPKKSKKQPKKHQTQPHHRPAFEYVITGDVPSRRGSSDFLVDEDFFYETKP